MEETWEVSEIWKNAGKHRIIHETEFNGILIQVKDKKYVRHLCMDRKKTRQSAIWKSKPFELQMQYLRDIVKVVDKVKDPEILESEIQRHPEAIMISSKNGTGIDLLQNAIIRCYENKLDSHKVVINYK